MTATVNSTGWVYATTAITLGAGGGVISTPYIKTNSIINYTRGTNGTDTISINHPYVQTVTANTSFLLNGMGTAGCNKVYWMLMI